MHTLDNTYFTQSEYASVLCLFYICSQGQSSDIYSFVAILALLVSVNLCCQSLSTLQLLLINVWPPRCWFFFSIETLRLKFRSFSVLCGRGINHRNPRHFWCVLMCCPILSSTLGTPLFTLSISFTTLRHRIKSLLSSHLAICSATSAPLHCFLSLHHTPFTPSLSHFHSHIHRKPANTVQSHISSLVIAFGEAEKREKKIASKSNYSTIPPKNKRKKDRKRGLRWGLGSG